MYLLSVLVLSAASLRLPAVFGDHIVLQRAKPVPVWGEAEAGAKVTVAFGGQKKSAVAGADGRWMVKLGALKASATPRTLVVTTGAGEKVEIGDVLVGEVWLGSGQSNMAMLVRNSRDYPAEQAAAKYPLIRVFKEESLANRAPQWAGKGQWAAVTPESVGASSAVLYFFGREVFQQLGGQVPVGLVNSSVGGTPIESWIDGKVQAAVPELKANTETLERTFERFDRKKADKKAVDTWARRGGPGDLFNGKIAPLIPFALRGVLWYQGEGNASPGRSDLYQHQLALLVNDWRSRWGEELPFAWAQLPNFTRAGDDWSKVQEAELRTLRLPKTGMAVTIDIGDPGNIHPTNKQDVGKRLANWALATVYKKAGVPASGPLPAKHSVRGGEVVVEFAHAHGGLKSRDGGALTGFTLAGSDGVYQKASARVVGSTVVVSSAGVTAPAGLRYAWESNPVCNLVNGAGLPASPFRLEQLASGR